MKTSSHFPKWTAALCVAGLTLSAYPVFAAESVSEKVSDAATDAWDATKKTAKDVGNAVEKKVDELKGDSASVKGNRVDVKLDESNIHMPSSIPSGTTSFVITNTGKKKHGFEIAGKGVELKKTVDPAETSVLSVDLKPGTYQIECPVGQHDEKGMKQELIVK